MISAKSGGGIENIFGSRNAILVSSVPFTVRPTGSAPLSHSYFHSSSVRRHSGSSECVFYSLKPVSVAMAVRMGQGSGQRFMSHLKVKVFWNVDIPARDGSVHSSWTSSCPLVECFPRQSWKYTFPSSKRNLFFFLSLSFFSLSLFFFWNLFFFFFLQTCVKEGAAVFRSSFHLRKCLDRGWYERRGLAVYWRISLACRWSWLWLLGPRNPQERFLCLCEEGLLQESWLFSCRWSLSHSQIWSLVSPSASPRPWAVFEDSDSETIYSLILSRSTQRQIRQDSCSETYLPIETNRPVNTGPSKAFRSIRAASRAQSGAEGWCQTEAEKQQVVLGDCMWLCIMQCGLKEYS